jgi:NAD(P)-dependent dehydrogenase (short-subunit alcohol dehydrogenase family)
VEAAVPAGVRISVCCAGIGWAEKVAGKRGAHALEPFARVIGVNLIGTFNVLRLAAAAANNAHGPRRRTVGPFDVPDARQKGPAHPSSSVPAV